MKRKILASVTAAGLTIGFGAAAASAGPPAGTGERGQPVGVACMQHGLGLLRSVGAPPHVSIELTGLPLNQVLALHRNDPQAAAGVLQSLGLPAGPCDLTAA